MRTAAVLVLALTSLAAAESSTIVSYFGAQWDKVGEGIQIPYYTSIAASVVDINAVETTYAVECLEGAPTSLCSIDTPWTLIQGDTTMSLTATYTAFEDVPVTVVRDIECSFTSKIESASCSFSVGMSYLGSNTVYADSTSASSTYPTNRVGYYELEVTGGLDKLTSPDATETPGAAAAGPAGALITAAPALAAAVVALL